jgi:CubicO group peptidase (beta-lactamase class C family)
MIIVRLIAGISSTLVSRYKHHGALVVLVFGLLSPSTSIVPLTLAQTPAEVSSQTYWPANDWRSSSPEAQGMDSAVLARAFDYVAQHKTPIHNLLIIRNGYVVLDANFYPYQAGQLHDGASMTKSITSSLIGIAIGQHKLAGVHQAVTPLFRQRTIATRDERKERVTIESLLTMTSGLDCRFSPGEVTLREMMQSRDWVQFMLDLPMVAEPGTKYEYCSGGMHLLSAIISQTAGANALEYARRELFRPLGISDVVWPSDPHDVSHGWGDLHLQPRDWARIGYLWLNHGRWGGRQIIPADWMEAATQVHSRASWGDQYGYGIWVYPDRKPPIYEGNGRGGQRLSVVPNLNLVVVMTGGGFEPGDIGDFIGQSIKSDRPLPKNPAAEARLAKVVTAAAGTPAAQPVTPIPAISKPISGKNYLLENNPVGLKSLSLTFSGGNEAVAHLEFADGRNENRPVGLDGVPRVSLGGRFHLPVALTGAWENNQTFVLDYDEVANINSFRFRLTFSDGGVNVDLNERTGLVKAKFNGTPVTESKKDHRIARSSARSYHQRRARLAI